MYVCMYVCMYNMYIYNIYTDNMCMYIYIYITYTYEYMHIYHLRSVDHVADHFLSMPPLTNVFSIPLAKC